MGIITGYLCVFFFLVLLAKYVTRKAKWEKANEILRQLHKPTTALFVLLMVLHLVLTIPVWKTREEMVVWSGIFMVVVALLMIILGYVMKKGRMKWHRVFAVILLILAVLHIGAYWKDFSRYQTKMDETVLVSIDLTQIEDGEYIGSYDVGYIYAKVKVTVKNHQMTQIMLLEHRNERGTPAEAITDTMVAQQSTVVDAVSGATNSSEVIMKACANALSGN